MTARPLWKCPGCGRSFANRNQSHACGRLDRSWLAEAHAVGEQRHLAG